MESQRNILIIGFLFVTFLLYQQWQNDNNPQVQAAIAQQSQTQSSGSLTGDVPSANQAESELIESASQTKLISVKSDLLDLEISVQGGDIVSAKLLEHRLEEDSEESFQLLNDLAGTTYIAQSGLIGANGSDAKERPVYKVAQDSFVIGETADELRVPMQFINSDGIVFTKTFVVKRGSYAVDVEYNVDNQSSTNASVQVFAQFKQTMSEGESSMMMPVYRGGAYSTAETRYKKYSFDDMQKNPLSIVTQGGWVAMMQHYFVSAWVPQAEESNELYSKVVGNFAYIGYKSSVATVAAGDSTTLSSTIWVGPKTQSEMAKVANHLDLTVDYGWLWFIAQPMFKLLNFFHGIVGNWGLAIIMITFTVKGLMFPLTKAQYTSMAKMRMLQPQLAELREKHGDDRQKMSQGMMELYKKEKVNPLGGCFPILLQMPIFIALYWSLMESVELRHQPFFGWITDLSVQDPLYILPVLMGASMFMIQRMSPTTVTDPMQQKIMQFMPVMFTVFFLWFPSGLVLYWLVSNIVTLIQQTLIYRNLEKKGLHSR
ncbi:membrane protein insertase YidC [Alginatibacterium sediminis]|uniref:Membrane protein insertase YidC n=1 Tax=Alginatibacterium sediminis TaxID=2164068 RepID=A0A420ENL1_9ALTE|nr:membrane protein insertase YidC [Alginatibacterium sediminis]RKF22251.1 membrane protein insertase YidC [Alginatibacterium sediminis]